MQVTDFVKILGARTAAPGGGSVAALLASIGSALGSMTGLLSYGKKKWEHIDTEMRTHIRPLWDT